VDLNQQVLDAYALEGRLSMALWKDKIRGDWCYDFQYQKQRYSTRGFNTKKEAAESQANKKRELKQAPQQQVGMALSEAAGLYLDHSIKKHIYSTYKDKRRVLQRFLAFTGKNILIQEITPKIIAAYLDTRPTNNSYNAYRKDLAAMFTYAIETLEIIEKNPVLKIKKLPHNVMKKNIPSEKDVIKLFLVAKPETDERALLIVLLHTLARINEVLKLRWDDVNFERRILIKRTKKSTDHSDKEIITPMNQELYDTLWDMWRYRKQNTWVFYNEDTRSKYNHRPKFMKGICKRAGIVPHFGFHTLRHLMASLLADNPKIATRSIQKLLGHTNIRTTEIYLHSVEGAVEAATDSLNGVFNLDQEKKKKNV
jgi:integrase